MDSGGWLVISLTQWPLSKDDRSLHLARDGRALVRAEQISEVAGRRDRGLRSPRRERNHSAPRVETDKIARKFFRGEDQRDKKDNKSRRHRFHDESWGIYRGGEPFCSL